MWLSKSEVRIDRQYGLETHDHDFKYYTAEIVMTERERVENTFSHGVVTYLENIVEEFVNVRSLEACDCALKDYADRVHTRVS
ncbi:hypothetical protein Tco_0214399 [Tanacetum coccineum]